MHQKRGQHAECASIAGSFRRAERVGFCLDSIRLRRNLNLMADKSRLDFKIGVLLHDFFWVLPYEIVMEIYIFYKFQKIISE